MTDEEFARQFPTMKWLLPRHEPPPPKHAWSELPGNIGPSAVDAATGLYDMVRHPIRTLQALETVAGGAMNLMGADELNAYLADRGLARRRHPQDVAREEAAAIAVGQALKDRYWGLENIRNTLITDPVGSLLDVAAIATGGAGAIRGSLSAGSKARLAEAPVAALNEGRSAVDQLGQTIAADTKRQIFDPPTKPPGPFETDYAKGLKIEEIGNRPVVNPLTRQLAEGTPEQTFLTKGLEKKKHSYPPDETVTLDRKKRKIFAPPNKPQRPFEADYVNGVKAGDVDKEGNLLVDRNNRPFNPGDKIFGRRTLGGDDVGASHKDFRELIKRLLGKPIKLVPRQSLKGSAQIRYYPNTDKPIDLNVADNLDLSKSRSKHIINHEGSHLMDILMGRAPMPPAVEKEAQSVYSTLATGKENLPKLTLPTDHEYSGLDVRNELMGEVVRGALYNPNFMKTVAPKTYEWLADLFAKHPGLGIRLNSLGAGTVAALWGMGQKEESQAAEMPKAKASQASSLRGAQPSVRPFTPFGPADKATKENANGVTEIKKALHRRGLRPQKSKNEPLRAIASVLVDLDTRKKSQFYGGPR